MMIIHIFFDDFYINVLNWLVLCIFCHVNVYICFIFHLGRLWGRRKGGGNSRVLGDKGSHSLFSDVDNFYIQKYP